MRYFNHSIRSRLQRSLRLYPQSPLLDWATWAIPPPPMAQQVPSELTPLLKQYYELKAQAGDALLLFRMGDFYELFGDDAIEASRILEITLTSRDKNKPDPLPMAGVPYHSVAGYLQKLLRAGKKVAISEQFEELKGSGSKSIVRRAIVRTLTPAIQFDGESAEVAYLATALSHNSKLALAVLDIATGDLRFIENQSLETFIDLVNELPIRHFLQVEHAIPVEAMVALKSRSSVLIEELPAHYLSFSTAQQAVCSQYGVAHLDAFLQDETAIHAIGILLTYALRSQPGSTLVHLRTPEPLRRAKSLVLGPKAYSSLDLDDLFNLINKTRSSLGSRQLKRLLSEPLREPDDIKDHQEAVQAMSDHPETVARIAKDLGNLYDLERIAGRLTTGLANPRDTYALGQSLNLLSGLAEKLAFAQTHVLVALRASLVEAAEKTQVLAKKILAEQKDEAPLVTRDGGIFKRGFNPDLDRLLQLTEEGTQFLVELETRERQATGISSLKVRYNRVFGYYIEITQAHVKSAPAHYQRKQTTVGSERFFTEELKKFEDEMVSASDRLKALEIKLFEELIDAARKCISPIMQAARLVGQLDTLQSLSLLTFEPGWSFPKINSGLQLKVESGRHPVVEASSHGRFVPNSIEFDSETCRTLLITGPNMGGKSTVMRQIALIVLLGQMGAPVPARSAQWGAFSSIYTRIGANDAIARGQSTFMVEMSELAHILHHADERSLIILDEIGRGTSTYDGMSVAWATLEWIAREIRARTLFATHYHELTRLSDEMPALQNAHMAVEQNSGRGGQLRFLYELKAGPTADSFGIQVARLAGIPRPVVDRAWQVLEELERNQKSVEGSNPGQLSLFSNETGSSLQTEPSELRSEPRVVEIPAPLPTWIENLEATLAKTPIDSMTPLEALNILAKANQLRNLA